MVVPCGTRSSGPGAEGTRPASAQASTASPGREWPSGCHIARTASSETWSTPSLRVPAETRLSLGWTTGSACGAAAAPAARSATQEKRTAARRLETRSDIRNHARDRLLREATHTGLNDLY